MIKIGDFIILSKDCCNIIKNSVGLVRDVKDKEATIFFIGKNTEIKCNITDIDFLDITQTNKPYKYKICNVCHILKEDYIDFEINQTDAKGRKTTRPTCRECRKKIDGVGLLSTEKKRMDLIKPKEIFICPICHKASIPFVTANLVIDHNHKNGKAREWICDSCNTGLGRFKDDISTMEEAIRYLKRHESD